MLYNNILCRIKHLISLVKSVNFKTANNKEKHARNCILMVLDTLSGRAINSSWLSNSFVPVNKAIIGSSNDLWPVRHRAIIKINAGILLIGSLWANFGKISIKIHQLWWKKIKLNMFLQNGGHFVLASVFDQLFMIPCSPITCIHGRREAFQS